MDTRKAQYRPPMDGMAPQALSYHYKCIAAGKCPGCGKALAAGENCCQRCAGNNKRLRLLLYNRRLKLGLCPGCGGPRDRDGIQCISCRARNRRSQKLTFNKDDWDAAQARLRKRRLREGLCRYCGDRIDDPTFKMCGKCRKKARDRYQVDPVGYKLRAILMGWIKPVPPVPLCPSCGLHWLRCLSCGRFMAAAHSEKRCEWRCRCGVKRNLQKPLDNPL